MKTKSKPQADLKALIAAQQDRYSISGDEIAAALGISRTTWYRLKNDLDSISLAQIQALRKLLHIKQEDLLACIKV